MGSKPCIGIGAAGEVGVAWDAGDAGGGNNVTACSVVVSGNSDVVYWVLTDTGVLGADCFK